MSDEPDAVRCGRWTREHGPAAVPVPVCRAEPPPGQKLPRFCLAVTNDVLEEAARRLCAI